MSDLRELYQELIIDHGRHPRNFSELPQATHRKEGYNPLCGDKVTIYAVEKNGVLEKITFQGCGCAISMASASLMTQILAGKSLEVAQEIFGKFHDVVTGKVAADEQLGKLAVLAGVKDYPSRVKCATLCWHTLQAALANSQENISTE